MDYRLLLKAKWKEIIDHPLIQQFLSNPKNEQYAQTSHGRAKRGKCQKARFRVQTVLSENPHHQVYLHNDTHLFSRL
nr:hypothetical protein [Bacillus pumilus]